MTNAKLGSISSGTLRTADLLETFSDALDFISYAHGDRDARSELINDAQRLVRQRNTDSEQATSTLDDLFNALQEYAPPYAYFGAHPDDGADFGFWITPDIGQIFDGMTVEDLSEVPEDYRGEVLHVNDHGNMTLYAAAGAAELTEIWSIV